MANRVIETTATDDQVVEALMTGQPIPGRVAHQVVLPASQVDLLDARGAVWSAYAAHDIARDMACHLADALGRPVELVEARTRRVLIRVEPTRV